MCDFKEKSPRNDILSVVFVTSGTRGDRLLFKYPFDHEAERAMRGKGRGKHKILELFYILINYICNRRTVLGC